MQNVGSEWWAKGSLAPLKRIVIAQCSPVLQVSTGTESSEGWPRTVQVGGKSPGLEGTGSSSCSSTVSVTLVFNLPFPRLLQSFCLNTCFCSSPGNAMISHLLNYTTSYGGGGSSSLSSCPPYITLYYHCVSLPVSHQSGLCSRAGTSLIPQCVQLLAQPQCSVGFYGITGSSQEAVALCFMNFRNLPIWRQLILPYYVHWRIRALDDFLRVLYMWVTIHLAPDREALMGEK